MASTTTARSIGTPRRLEQMNYTRVLVCREGERALLIATLSVMAAVSAALGGVVSAWPASAGMALNVGVANIVIVTSVGDRGGRVQRGRTDVRDRRSRLRARPGGSFFAGEVVRGSTTAVTADAAAGIGKTPELGEGKILFLGSA